ncbi:hypothetical protein Pyn_17716 [Prunus yedoensis var. nudiflora]|uniref:Uncharacterized protein n=2 Tax=Prunus yedoensis var. nudiflora TaxID=2094558 RepID=A0A314XIG6_PRUYE|nr:hypothetical protein Pyn_17716 [Prunus yedoensis var. nudiflora]
MGWLSPAPPREMACRRMKWYGLSDVVVATPTSCCAQACRTAGSPSAVGPTLTQKKQTNNIKDNPNNFGSGRRVPQFFHFRSFPVPG